ncbi:hypothetical protein [Parasphingorhabdus sp.]|uniref:hypothetical protein n=1 Tax=Parasphingorhabdus sp. TaxID=2709688 RepID=UPI0032F06907
MNNIPHFLPFRYPDSFSFVYLSCRTVICSGLVLVILSLGGLGLFHTGAASAEPVALFHNPFPTISIAEDGPYRSNAPPIEAWSFGMTIVGNLTGLARSMGKARSRG